MIVARLTFDELSQLWRRLLFYSRRDRFGRELEEEMRFHLEMRAEENLAAGTSQDEAWYAAQRQFGNQALLREVSRNMWGFRSLETIGQDMRYGMRMLFKHKGFTAVSVLTLALGIGANTAIFSVVDRVLLSPLPYHDPDRLIALFQEMPSAKRTSISYPNLVDWREMNHSFSSIAGYHGIDVNVLWNGEAEHLPGEMVSSGFFEITGIKPISA